MERKLVSVLIPCFNAERWLREAIDSCLQQTYPEIEIVVVDDGSTDNSLEIIKSYGDQIIWESGANRGGNYARNRGFALSSGEYIQYLDSDDYLLPEKIERQVRFIEETKADVVYGDFKFQRHLSDRDIVIEPGNFFGISGPQEDILESLLAYGCLPPLAYLFRRSAVVRSGGWDESLKAGQDRDFLISVLLKGAKVVYQPGCYSVYRRYGNLTVSSFNRGGVLENHCWLLEKAEKKLSHFGRLSIKYRKALATSYFSMAKEYQWSLDDQSQYLRLLEKTLLVFSKFEIKNSASYNLIQKIFGFPTAERISHLKYLTRQWLSHRKKVLLKVVKQGKTFLLPSQR